MTVYLMPELLSERERAQMCLDLGVPLNFFDVNPYHVTSGEKGGQFTSTTGVTSPTAQRRPRTVNVKRGVAFVSPNIEEHLDLLAARTGITGDRQKALRQASREIDRALKIKGEDANIIGAWADGAENSIMTTVEDADWERMKVAAAMKGYLADQKSVLVFQEDDGGDAALYKFKAKGSIGDIHDNLIKDGVRFHTLEQTLDGANVTVADLDGKALEAVDKAAKRYDAEVEYHQGHAEYVGTTKADGTEREQRDDARRAYEEAVGKSEVQESRGVWQRVRRRWGQTLNPDNNSFLQEENGEANNALAGNTEDLLDVTDYTSEGCLGFLTPEGEALAITTGDSHETMATKSGTTLLDVFAEGGARMYFTPGDFLGIEITQRPSEQQMRYLREAAAKGKVTRFVLDGFEGLLGAFEAEEGKFVTPRDVLNQINKAYPVMPGRKASDRNPYHVEKGQKGGQFTFGPGVVSAGMPLNVGGRHVTIVQSKLDARAGNPLVAIDVNKFDQAFAREREAYIGRGGTGNSIRDRYQRFVAFLKANDTIEASTISVGENGRVDFINGRHRYAVMRDLGVKVMPVVITADTVENARKAGYLVEMPQPSASPAEPDDKLLLISRNPNFDRIDKWSKEVSDKHIEADRTDPGGADASELYRMQAALSSYRGASYDAVEKGDLTFIGIHGGPRDADDTQLLATVWSRMDTNGTANIEVGAIDRDARVKVLRNAIALLTTVHPADFALRIEAHEFEDKEDVIQQYIEAGFRREKSEGGVTTLSYGQVAAPKPVRTAEHAKATLDASRKVATELGYDPKLVSLGPEAEPYKFELNGRKYLAAGIAHISKLSTQWRHIKLWPEQMLDIGSVPGVVAHEIEHQKFQHALDAYKADIDKVMKEPGPAPDPNHPYFWGKRGGSDAVMKPDGGLREPYDKQYPIYTAFHAAYQAPGSGDLFMKSDGVTNYSHEYWKGWKTGTTKTDSAFHETLAEMARVKYETGKFPDHLGLDKDETKANRAAGAKLWRDLYRVVEKIWKEHPPT
jgi:hypothetical protein